MSAESVNGAFTAKNYMGVQGVFARQTSDGTDYMLKNGHGDVAKLVRNGAVVQNYDFDAFGNQKTETTNDTNPFRYAGEYTDFESGLIYLRNRYYNPETQRFITEDPIKDGLNWYAYCYNNPVMFVDPSGMNSVWIREWFESKNGTVKPKKKLGIWGLSAIVVSLPGQESVTYKLKTDSNSVGYTIKNDLAYIDESILKQDFKTDGVYLALIIAYGERGTKGTNSRNWMKRLYPDSFNAEQDSWCITFVSWALEQAGLPSPKTYSVAKAIDWYTNRGTYNLREKGVTPNVGDTMFIGTEHSGLVIAYDPPWVYTIEGCSQGDKVNVVKRHESTITAYGRNGGTDAGAVPENYDYTRR